MFESITRYLNANVQKHIFKSWWTNAIWKTNLQVIQIDNLKLLTVNLKYIFIKIKVKYEWGIYGEQLESSVATIKSKSMFEIRLCNYHKIF